MKKRVQQKRPRAGQAFIERFDHKQRLMQSNVHLKQQLEETQKSIGYMQEQHQALMDDLRKKNERLRQQNDFMRGLLPDKNLAIQFFEGEMTQQNKNYLEALGILKFVAEDGCSIGSKMKSWSVSRLGLMADLDLRMSSEALYTLLCTSRVEKRGMDCHYIKIDGLTSQHIDAQSSVAISINDSALRDHRLDLLIYSAGIDIVASLLMKIRIQLLQSNRRIPIRMYSDSEARDRAIAMLNDDADHIHKKFLMELPNEVKRPRYYE